jgi:hypothetical protein
MALLSFKYARKYVQFGLPLREIASYLLASLVVFIYSRLFGGWEVEVKRFWVDAPILAFHVLVSLILYFAVVVILSSWFRSLVRRSLLTLLKQT